MKIKDSAVLSYNQKDAQIVIEMPTSSKYIRKNSIYGQFSNLIHTSNITGL